MSFDLMHAEAEHISKLKKRDNEISQLGQKIIKRGNFKIIKSDNQPITQLAGQLITIF